jgi:hypothetical protein
MTDPVTSLDARALVSEIQQRLENLPEQPWSIEEIRPGHEDEARVYDAGHWGVCKPTPNKPQYRRPIAEFVVAAPRLLTAALGLMEQQQWQPIETAPKDGTPVLLWERDETHDADAITIGAYVDFACIEVRDFQRQEPGSYRSGWYDNIQGHCELQPTHWMPLPSPPSLAGARPVATEGDTK